LSDGILICLDWEISGLHRPSRPGEKNIFLGAIWKKTIDQRYCTRSVMDFDSHQDAQTVDAARGNASGQAVNSGLVHD